MDELIAFLGARLDEDELAAQAMVAAFGQAEWVIRENGEFDYTVTAGQLTAESVADLWREDAAAWIARHDPACVLREVEADRQLLTALRAARGFPGRHDGLLLATKIRAARFSGHPGYRQEWAP